MSDEEKVGPGRPPRHTRWKKGQSGNPRGRPSGRLSVRMVLEEELSELMTLATSRGEREVTKLQAIVRRLIHEGLSGKVYAIQDILDRAERLDRVQDATAPVELAVEDEAILRRAQAEPDMAAGERVAPSGKPVAATRTEDARGGEGCDD